MPVYEYQCKACGRDFEYQQRMTDPEKTVCEACGGALDRLISRTAFALKGGGWYKDLYASPKPETGGKPEGDKGDKANGKPDAAPADKSAAKPDAPAAAADKPAAKSDTGSGGSGSTGGSGGSSGGGGSTSGGSSGSVAKAS